MTGHRLVQRGNGKARKHDLAGQIRIVTMHEIPSPVQSGQAIYPDPDPI